jgi:hypothetical protein
MRHERPARRIALRFSHEFKRQAGFVTPEGIDYEVNGVKRFERHQQ